MTLIVTSPIQNWDLETIVTAVNIGIFTVFDFVRQKFHIFVCSQFLSFINSFNVFLLQIVCFWKNCHGMSYFWSNESVLNYPCSWICWTCIQFHQRHYSLSPEKTIEKISHFQNYILQMAIYVVCIQRVGIHHRTIFILR